MENIAKMLELIVNQSESNKATFEQVLQFEDTMKNLQKLVPMEKPTYNLPQVDTIGKSTYLSLNKKVAY